MSNLPESKGCSKKSDVEKTTDKTTDKPANKGEATDKPEAPTEEPVTKPEETQSKVIGDKCAVKTECGVNSCIAAKCISK